MKYSDYFEDQIVSPMYEKVTQKMLTLVKDEEIKRKMSGILYEGGFDNFSVNGSFHMEERVLYRDNPNIESTRRLNMAYLLLTNPQMVEVIQKSKGCFFHGTNANALPSILRYGINSSNRSIENNINVTTGEKCYRNNGQRGFVSLTDCLDVAQRYANISAKNNNDTIDELLNFGTVIGTSLEKMDGLNVFGVNSDLPSEIGVSGNLPIEHIKFLAVPKDKVEFVRKMVGEKAIEVVEMDMGDLFFDTTYVEKFNLLEQMGKSNEESKSLYPTFDRDDVKPVVNERKITKIKEIFNALKEKICMQNKNDKNISGRE